MDCYIVRVYRHIMRANGEEDEIAGLVERVGERDSGRPFSSYQALVSLMRGDSEDDKSADVDDVSSEAADRLRLVHAAKSS